MAERGHQISDPGQPGEGFGMAASPAGQRVDLGEHLPGRGSGHVGTGHRCGRGGQRGGVLGAARELDSQHVRGQADVQPGFAQCVAQLAAERAVRAAEHDRGATLDHLGRMGGTAQRGHGPRRTALGYERRRRGAQRRHKTLGQDQHARVARDVLAVGCDHAG